MATQIFRVEMPTPFEAAGPVNGWLIPGPEPALVDVGPRTDEAWDALLAALDRYRVSPDALRHIVVTHAHVDHYGNAARLAALAPRATVYAPDLAHARPMLLDEDGEWARQGRFARRVLLASGLTEAQIERSLLGPAILRNYGAAVPVTRWIRPGETLRLGERGWEIVALPGHSMTQIGLLDRANATFIAADHLLPRISTNAVLEPPPPGEHHRPRALPIYVDSLRASAALPPMHVLPGHGDPFTDQRPLIERRLAGIEQRAATLHSLLADGPSPILGLVERLFPGIRPEHFFLAVSEVVGHLDLLEKRGLVRYADNGVRLYRRSGDA